MIDTVCTVLLILLVMILIITNTYQIFTDYYNRKRMYDVQIEMAQAQQMMSKDMSWDDARKILNDIISFTVSNYIINNGITKMKDDELSIMWTMMLGDICTTVEMAMSDELKRQIMKTVTREYFSQYVKNSVQITIVYQLETNKKNTVNTRLERIQNASASPKTPEGENTKK
jgi:hypothetical protein